MRTPTVVQSSAWLGAVLVGLAAMLVAAPCRADDLKDGRAALQAGRYDEALQFYEKAAGQGFADGRAGVGLVWLKRHAYAKAMDAFLTAEKMDSQNAMAQFGQGEVLRQEEKCEEAVPKLQRAVELDRKFPEAQLSLTDCLTQLKRWPEALASANRGLNWGAKWRPRFLVAMGNISAAQDSLRDASIWYTTAVQEAPEDPATHRALGDFYVKRGTFELAYPEYQAAVARDSLDVDLHFALGQALYFGQRYNDALDEFRWVVIHDPEFPAGQLALGDLLYRSGKADARRYSEAREPLEKYVQLRPDDGRGWSVLGRTYYYVSLAEKDSVLKDQALAALTKAEQLGDKSKEMYTIRARLHVERRELDQAMQYYALAGSDLAPEDQFRLARINAIQKNPARAESLYLAIWERDSTTRTAAAAMNELGKLRYGAAVEQARADKQAAVPYYEEAISAFQRRLTLDPNSDEAYYYIGLSYNQMGQYPEALAAMRQSAALGPGKADRHFWLGLLYRQLDSTAMAEQEFQQAVQLDTGNSANKALALQQLGYFRLLQKDYPGAIDLLEQSVAINGRDAGTLLWLAQAYQNAGNRAKATENYRRVLAIDPANADATRGLKMVQGGGQ